MPFCVPRYYIEVFTSLLTRDQSRVESADDGRPGEWRPQKLGQEGWCLLTPGFSEEKVRASPQVGTVAAANPVLVL